jgi:alpha-beta hydrolase superfamily lysophospholipase
VSAVRAVLLAAAMGLMAATIPAGSAAASEQLLPAAAVSGAAVPGVPRAAGPGAWWRSAGRVLLLLGLGYALLSAYMFVFQSRFVYFPDRDLIADPGALRLAFEDVRVPTRDGGTIHGWFVPAGGSGRGVILKCHGNGGNISHRLESIYQFHSLGFATFIFDYRGYGRSPGRPSEDGTYRDVEAAWRYLTHDRGIPASRILVFGRSLGGAIAAWLASREAPGALVVESSFSSIPDIGREVYPFLPVRLLSRFSYNTRAAVHAARCPVIVVHSRDDEMISIRHGRAIFEAAPTPKTFIEIRGGHNEAFMTWPDYLARLDAAITPWFPRAGGTAPGEPSPAREQADRPLTGSGTAGGP